MSRLQRFFLNALIGSTYLITPFYGRAKQVTKRKWSLSNLMTVVHILLNSYIDLYDFLNLPEGQWLRIIQSRSPEDDISPQLEFLTQKEGPNFENYKTNAYLQAVNQ